MTIDWNTTLAAIWRQRKEYLRPVSNIDPIRLQDLLGIEQQKQQLVRNTLRFLAGQPANNALLWGARGTGKSSLIKALLNEYQDCGLRMVEVDKEDLVYLPEIVDEIRDLTHRFVIFCDDLSFDTGESRYKALKSVLEGSIEQPPANVLLYATSNRRHLLPEYMQDNLASRLVEGEIHHSEAVEEKISLSDRFGLWLSFYPINNDDYLKIVDSYFTAYPGDRDALHAAALEFASLRASKSGRTARQFYNGFVENDKGT
jgi:predicted AAA+ superfamily ATPase